MGVITTAYSIPPNLMRKIRVDNDNLAFVFGKCEDDERWKLEDHDFDKGIEETISILREAGCPKTAKGLDCEYADLDVFDFGGYDIWTIPPSQVKAMLKELENAKVEELEKKGNTEKVTDRRGNVMPESLYLSYLGDIEGIKKFFQKTAEQGNYLLFSEA